MKSNNLIKKYSDILKKIDKLVIVDIETTGLDSALNEIIEIGAIKVEKYKEITDAFQILITPSCIIPGNITRITGITQEMLDREGISLSRAMNDFLLFTQDLPLIAYNAGFDMSFLRKAASLKGIAITNPVLCALKLARAAWPGRRSYRLTKIAAELGHDVKGAHRAVNDCVNTLHVYTAASEVIVSVR